ncbi:MAG: anti-sigma factor family protein [Sporichthyaceae bacterium]
MSHLGPRLGAYLDGELRGTSQEVVTAHLVLCADCRAEASAHHRVKAGLSALGAPAPPTSLMASLLDLSARGEARFAATRPVVAERAAAVSSAPRRPLMAAGIVSVAAATLASAYLSGGPARAQPTLSTVGTPTENQVETRTTVDASLVLGQVGGIAPAPGSAAPAFFGHVRYVGP